MKKFSESARSKGGRIAFVPTMGYLHEGHLSLLREARKAGDIAVLSIFVNPLQFGPSEDFRKYPRALARDRRLAEEEGCDVLFLPLAGEMYPEGDKTRVEIPGLSDVLCGRSRPGHFTGVLTVVAKLLNVVNPDFLMLGRKDAQQAVLIGRMMKDLHFCAKPVVCPTVREPGGLAMSSRNKYLSRDERNEALALYRALLLGRNLVESGERRAGLIIGRMRRLVGQYPLVKLEYISLVHPETLEKVGTVGGKVMIALAAKVGRARLIDNIMGSGLHSSHKGRK